MTHSADPELQRLIASLSLEEKVTLLTGRDGWSTQPIESIGLRSMVLSDGPSGVRGDTWDERSPSLSLPSATALSASWDVAVARKYAETIAAEARRKGVDVVLGPTINLHRSPLGGRHFEAFSEDPLLTAEMAAAYVSAMQESGVAATPKHYVANDSETDRFTVDVAVGDRALRELYLAAFEKAITDSHAWAVMSAYNSINGTTATENELLETPLNSEWGFDGVVVSDWMAVRSVASALASQDLAMPGPEGPWGQALIDAVRDGSIDESAIDRKVLRLLRLASRVGALSGFGTARPVADGAGGTAFAREAAVEGAVLVCNDGILPLTEPARIAVIGANANTPRVQGGGSATVVPAAIVSPLEGILARYPEASIDYAVGAVVSAGITDFPLSVMTNPVTGEPGAHVSLLGADGSPIYEEERFGSHIVFAGGPAPIREAAALEFHTRFTPTSSEGLRIGVSTVGKVDMFLDGQLSATHLLEPIGDDLGAAFLNPPAFTTDASVHEGEAIDVRIRIERTGPGALMSSHFGTEPADPNGKALIEAAADIARDADVTIVVVGTDEFVESEGFDRKDLTLPGLQNDLVHAIAAANPRTVVVVNAGSPIEMPWRDDVAAILLTWFGGQEYGAALADVISGDREPGGRLPTTWPVSLEDVPVHTITPTDGILTYEEGIHIGYRAWLRAGRTPAYPFGFGLGYTTWELVDLTIHPASDDGDVELEVTVRNTGDRAGKQVVQIYASRDETDIDRPVTWLVGWSALRLASHEIASTRIRVPRRAFSHWAGEWAIEPGRFNLRAAFSVDEPGLSGDVDLPAGERSVSFPFGE